MQERSSWSKIHTFKLDKTFTGDYMDYAWKSHQIYDHNHDLGVMLILRFHLEVNSRLYLGLKSRLRLYLWVKLLPRLDLGDNSRLVIDLG